MVLHFTGVPRRGHPSTQSDQDLREDLAQERESIHQLKSPRLLGWVIGGCVTFVSFTGVVTAERQWVKNFATGWFYGGIAVLVLNETLAQIYARRAKEYVDQELADIPKATQSVYQWRQYYDQQSQQWQQLQTQYTTHIAQLTAQIQSLIQQHDEDQKCLDEAIAHSSQTESAQEKNSLAHQQEINRLTQKLEQLGEAVELIKASQSKLLSDMVTHSKFTIYQIIHEWQKRLFALLDNARIHQQPIPELKDLHDLLNQTEASNKHKIDNYQAHGDLNQVADQLLSLLHYAGRDYAELHSKIQLATNSGSNQNALTDAQAQVTRLTAQLNDIRTQDLIPRAAHTQALEQLQTKSQRAIATLQQQLEAVINDSSTDQAAQQAFHRLEQVESHNKALLARIQALSAPILYRPAHTEDQRMSNAIATYFAQQGLILDRAYSDYHKWKATLYFHVDRNPKIILESELNEHSPKLTQLTHSMVDPIFTFDKTQGLMGVAVQMSHKPPVGASEVNRIWKTVDQFEAIAAKMSPRIRVTGGSEGGKSPTAENLAVCILKAKAKAKIPHRVRVGNPQFHSRKNHWSLPQHWKSHEENFQALKELRAHLDARSQGTESRDLFDMYLFDETDSTITQYGKSATDLIFYALKQVSHQHMGLILIGQSPNASNYNSQRADWENAVSVHIGSASLHAIEKDDGLASDDKNSLKKQWEILNDYCESQNKKMGFHTSGETQTAEGFRFAWVREPKGHYWIELPAFGRYQYDQVSSVDHASQPSASRAETMQPNAAECSDDAGNPDSSVAAKAPAPTYLGQRCKKCKTGTFVSSKKSRGILYYLCGDCGKSTSEKVLYRNTLHELETLLPTDDEAKDDD